jgi:hypothetical protein
MARCSEEIPVPLNVGNNHIVNCHLYD